MRALLKWKIDKYKKNHIQANPERYPKFDIILIINFHLYLRIIMTLLRSSFRNFY